MSRANGVKVEDTTKLLVERIASSRYFNRSARLRDMLLYLSDRAFEGKAEQIHEQEVGNKVFGRPPDYDTTTDNIARVHASLLRRRLEQYFSADGADEPLILEIPRGNYAPMIRERAEIEPHAPAHAQPKASTDWRIRALAALAALFACSTTFLLLRGLSLKTPAAVRVAERSTVRLFWSQLFRPNQPTDVVLDDASVGLYQDIAGRPFTLSDYFDRSYLRTLPETAVAAKLDQEVASSIILRRNSSYANANFLWKLLQIAPAEQRQVSLHFARDYSFRELKTNNVVLLGNSRSNPWVEPFEGRLGLRWAVYDKTLGVYYPVDSWADSAGKTRFRPAEAGERQEGYFLISLLPNLGGSGNVLMVSGTGGTAINAGADFLADEEALSQLRSLLPASKEKFPYFEALVRIKRQSSLPRDAVVVVCRSPRLLAGS